MEGKTDRRLDLPLQVPGNNMQKNGYKLLLFLDENEYLETMFSELT